MRRLLLLFSCLLAIICAASCRKSDNATLSKPSPDSLKKPVIITPPPVTLVGRWDVSAEKFVKYRDGAEISNTTGAAAPYNLAYVIFNNDSTYTCLAMDWYPALSTYGVVKDEVAGTYRLADSSLSVSSYLAGLNTIYYGGPPNSPPTLTPVSDKMVLRQFTDSTLTVHHEYVFNATDPSAGPIGNYKYIWDLYYRKHGY
ncbi:hypothetical protein ACRQ5D_09320 [Mucilaginibacter sp. P25]|uniref:Lipocalin-like domain-containing protein n=1 Tax=Mucilaginibacter gossypii TaxID=551996 RepID=A0A1G8HYY2_9SPHI|nr:hypothetical protein [Mucilaginibacter gossypii]SDI11838.1 hypothetical protein SAMN05192573_11670 [Mucilaginibacter gossypii]